MSSFITPVSSTAPAIVAPESNTIDYATLEAIVTNCSAQLLAEGIGTDDRIAFAVPNGVDAALLFLIAATHATAVPLNPAYRSSEIDLFLESSSATAVIVPGDRETPAAEVARSRGLKILTFASDSESLDRFHIVGPCEAPPAPARARGPEDVALLLHTSGTTSRPKPVPLTIANLRASARNISKTLGLGPNDRCLNVMPLFHIHGLVGCLLSTLASGGSIVCTGGFESDGFFTAVEALRPTWTSAVPTIHQAILQSAPENVHHSLRFIRSSSAALPKTVLDALEDRFEVPVIEAYGMTEASHQMASNPMPPAKRKPGSVGPAAGPEIAILDSEGKIQPTGARGEVAIRGTNVTRGYENRPEANDASFTGGWFRTGDEGFLDRDGYLFLTGRLKEMINRGGEKISPIEVDEALLAHGAVAQAVTFAMPHPTLGEDVGAAVVLAADRTVSADDLRRFVAERIAEFKAPRRIVFLDSIPKGPTGKLQRIGLAATLGLDGTDLHEERRAPLTDDERRIAEIWREILRLPAIGPDDDFFLLGGDSLAATRMLARLREQFGVEITIEQFFENATLQKLAGFAFVAREVCST